MTEGVRSGPTMWKAAVLVFYFLGTGYIFNLKRKTRFVIEFR